MPLKFARKSIAHESFESAGVWDVDGDGVLDIVSGAYWYQGPDFVKRHPIGEVKRFGEYYDDFSTIPLQIGTSGRTDFVTGGWWGGTLRWRENPGQSGKEWQEHVIAQVGNVETTRAWDVDGDGELEIVPNTPGHDLAYYKVVRDAKGVGTGAFTRHLVRAGAQGHGLGFGDLLGDGRGCFIVRDGWIEPPAPGKTEWIHHPAFDLGSASVPVIVADVNGDGIPDLIAGNAHGYGLWWWEQKIVGGKRTFTRHAIDPDNSQYHDMQWVDIDGDGKNELVTGKRFRAHCDNDDGAHDDVGIYYFKWNGESFTKQIIAYGPYAGGGFGGAGKGCGIHFAVADLTGSGRLDIIAPGKDGLAVFTNLGMTGQAAAPVKPAAPPAKAASARA